jgi:hypothetical protein
VSHARARVRRPTPRCGSCARRQVVLRPSARPARGDRGSSSVEIVNRTVGLLLRPGLADGEGRTCCRRLGDNYVSVLPGERATVRASFLRPGERARRSSSSAASTCRAGRSASARTDESTASAQGR